MFSSFRQIIETWPTRRAMADAIGGRINRDQVLKWYERDFIPGENWAGVARAMHPNSQQKRRALLDTMAALAERRLAA